ncbi:hypothetical protein JVT61DRAFT_7945 [Boletus reticuloceps]|uniref:Uncharacterized protein n=1 Tax=Boletus reticuloceps TaxID=495285 RepID=A0A8I3A7A1_9AGAM|nr:hypothetical protein JVT61DRAFT_7945 [Boletus reticuloceps]
MCRQSHSSFASRDVENRHCLNYVEEFKDASSLGIQGGLTFRENRRFILYTSSQDFSPNKDTDFDRIRDFVNAQLSLEDPQQMLHAIWVCMDTPLEGERLDESGVERILDVTHKKVPLIVVLTKFDLLVNSTTSTENTSGLGVDDEIDEIRETAERLLDDTLKKVPLDSLLSQQLVTPVSTMAGYEDTISTLIQSTDGAIKKLSGKRTHDLSIPLTWEVAQRQDLETTVTATIDVGRKRHWSGLGSTTEFRGRVMEHCIYIIHQDIIAIWNVQDDSSYLGGEDFKARMSHLVEELAYTSQNDMAIPTSPGAAVTFAGATANPIAAIGAVAEAAKWVSDVYQATPTGIACIMGYIVDLIMVLSFLSEIHQFPAVVLHGIEEEAVNAIKAYISSGLLSVTHKEIGKFVAADEWREPTDREDIVLEKIVRLVNKFHPRARDFVKKASHKLPSPVISAASISDKSFEQRAKGESVLSRQPPLVKPFVPRRGALDVVPDILTIVEEATKIPTSSSSSEGLQHPALLVPETNTAESLKHSPSSLLNWIRGERVGTDEDAGKNLV